MTRIEAARLNILTAEMAEVAETEKVPIEFIMAEVAKGTIVIPANRMRKRKAIGIGRGLRTKVSASIGTPKDGQDYAIEFTKMDKALAAQTDTLMDLSIGGNLDYMRRQVLARSQVPVGTLPVYQTFMEASFDKGIIALDAEKIFQDIEKQAKDGVDFMGLHCAMTRRTLELARNQGRITDLVSWGGALLAGWMLYHDKENPLYTEFDRILEIAHKYDVTLSLADGLRPGCIADSLDRAQVQELVILGELVDRARAAGVQIMIKGPGHAPLPHIASTVLLMKQICNDAPYFVFGPITTDVAPGYDHITAAIGGAFAAAEGADFICYVTPAEHVRFPDIEDVYEGVMAARIAAHVGDIAKGILNTNEWDSEIARARNPWNLEIQKRVALDPTRLGEREALMMEGARRCVRCGEKCAMQVVSDYFGKLPACC